MKVNFVVRKTKKKSDGCVPLEMTISVKGERRYVATGRDVKPSDFNVKTQSVKGDKEFNDFLKALKARLYSIETYLLTKGINVSIESVLDVYRNGEDARTISLLQLFDKHNEDIRKKVSQKLITESTLSKYAVTRDYVARFLLAELDKDDVLVKKLTPSFFENYFVFLLKYMSNNTAIQKMKQIKRLMRFAVEEGYISTSPFKMTLKKEKKEVHPLTIKEINAIRKKTY